MRRCAGGSQNIAGDGEFVGGGADVFRGVMQHEVLDMDELAVDPERGAGVSEMGAFDKARADRGTGDPLVEARQRDAGVAFNSRFQMSKTPCAGWG